MGVTTGPEIIGSVFGGRPTVISDPLSFPWGLDEPEHWRVPVLIDLSRCTDDDITALVHHLVVTPEDRLVVRSEHRSRIEAELSIPPTSLLDSFPDDPGALLAPLEGAKLRRSLLREVLEPIIRRELAATGGIGDSALRPLRVLDLGADDWRSTLVPEPHVHTTVGSDAEIVIVEATDLDRRSFDALAPGGLLLILLGDHLPDVMSCVDSITGPSRTVEHVWGLHSRPGRPTLGGVVGIRPLGRVP